QAQGREKRDCRAQTGLADGELPEVLVEVRGEQIEVEVGIKEQPLGGKILVVIGVQGNLSIGAEVVGVFKIKSLLRGVQKAALLNLVEGPAAVLQEFVLHSQGKGKFLLEQGLQVDL